mmetsp:Transcript_2345/g.7029  ORF Transcript_2345/g.7029 Transcript_2345/m.7029 type:complete len:104 (-) Transcript_2345:50-361(-)
MQLGSEPPRQPLVTEGLPPGPTPDDEGERNRAGVAAPGNCIAPASAPRKKRGRDCGLCCGFGFEELGYKPRMNAESRKSMLITAGELGISAILLTPALIIFLL